MQNIKSLGSFLYKNLFPIASSRNQEEGGGEKVLTNPAVAAQLASSEVISSSSCLVCSSWLRQIPAAVKRAIKKIKMFTVNMMIDIIENVSLD